MVKHKRLIVKWLHEFVEVMCDLYDTDFRLSVESGFGQMNVPADIYDAFVRRGIVERMADGRHFFVYNHGGGDTVVMVARDTVLRSGLILSVVK